MSPRDVRSVFGEIPFLLGKYPDRPSPVHIVNGFLASALGTGAAAVSVRKILRDPETPLPTPPFRGEILGQLGADRLRQSLRVVLDPDRRSWKDIGSLFPLHGGLVGKDPSDNNFGRDVWRMLRPAADEIRVDLQDLLYPQKSDAVDALTSLALILGELRKERGEPDARSELNYWETNSGTLSGQFRRGSVELIQSASRATPGRSRSARLSQLAAAVHFVAWMTSMRTPALLRPTRPTSWGELAPLFFYAGTPPGDPLEASVRIAGRSFEACVAEHRKELQAALAARLASVRLPQKLPKSQRARTLVRQTLKDLDVRQLNSLEEAVGQLAEIDEIVDVVFEKIYPPGHLERGFRSMGRKIGVAGPDRGRGVPRFLLETSVLGMLVGGTLARGERLTYGAWLGRLYDRFGIVVGFSDKNSWSDALSGIEDPGPLYHALEFNHEQMRRRLLRAGLANEYSDGATEVHGRGNTVEETYE